MIFNKLWDLPFTKFFHIPSPIWDNNNDELMSSTCKIILQVKTLRQKKLWQIQVDTAKGWSLNLKPDLCVPNSIPFLLYSKAHCQSQREIQNWGDSSAVAFNTGNWSVTNSYQGLGPPHHPPDTHLHCSALSQGQVTTPLMKYSNQNWKDLRRRPVSNSG